jgi:hypothetical protein
LTGTDVAPREAGPQTSPVLRAAALLERPPDRLLENR